VAPSQGPGSVGLAADGAVVRLRGERFGPEVASAEFLGIAVWGHAAAALMPARGCLIGDVCLPWLRAGGSIQSHATMQPWFDIGSLTGLAAANGHWLAQSRTDAYVAPDAVLAREVQVVHSLIGAKCRVSGAGEVRRSILLPGCHALAPLSDRLVLPSGQSLPLDVHSLALVPTAISTT
jgi:mannose-1-phosphate guanylyltransferase